MIISHEHKFIFIKTIKTAGTSIEIALSKYCGPRDVITPISREDELARTKLGYATARNYAIPLKKYSKLDFLRAAYRRKRIAFTNHASASQVMKYSDRNVWNSYFKFCFERNPWDKVISMYYWTYKTEPRVSLSDFIHSGELRTLKGFDLYAYASEIIVDRVFKYEHLDRSMQELCDQTGLDEVPLLPNAKGNYRKDKRSYRELLSAKDRDKIAKVYAREIAYFGYQW